MGTIYIKSKLGITHFAHNYMETSHVTSKPKLLKTLAWSGNWTHDLQITCLMLSHLSYPGMLISWVQLLFELPSVCLPSLLFPCVDVLPYTYYSSAGGCHPSITILLKWHLAITEKDQSTYWNRKGSSEARWWNPECINTYKVSTIFITDYILSYIKEICMGTIYIKSNLGITHFAHNYMETSHVASKPKLLKTLARSGNWTHDLQITCLMLSHLSYPGMLSWVQLLFELPSVCLTSLRFPQLDAILASIPITLALVDAIQASLYYWNDI